MRNKITSSTQAHPLKLPSDLLIHVSSIHSLNPSILPRHHPQPHLLSHSLTNQPTILLLKQTNAMKILNIASLPPIPPPKTPNSKKPLIPITTLKTLASLTPSLIFPTSSKSLTYDEALNFTNPSLSFDFSKTIDSIVNFGSQNPLIVAGGVAAVLIPVIVSRTFGRSKSWGVESAKSAYGRLGEDEGSLLLDIREGKEFKEAGSPDLGGLKKKVVRIGYGGEDELGFLKKVGLKFKDPGSTTLFVIDK